MSTTTQSYADVLIAKAQAKGYKVFHEGALTGFRYKQTYKYHWFKIDEDYAMYDHSYSQNTGKATRFKIMKQMELKKRLGW